MKNKCIICNKNIADMCGECMLKSQLEVGNKRYKKALKDFVGCIDIELLFTDLISTKTKEKIEISKELQEFLNEYNKYIIQRLESIAKELRSKDEN
jgi:hypothetical protein